MLPVDDKFVEEIAKSIAKSRILYEAGIIIEELSLNSPAMHNVVEILIDDVFENTWNDINENNQCRKDMYRLDAKAAIAAINLKLLTLKE